VAGLYTAAAAGVAGEATFPLRHTLEPQAALQGVIQLVAAVLAALLQILERRELKTP
jgi:hypothetical protein